MLIIKGVGRRSAESYDGRSSRAPKLCVEYINAPSNVDCPVLFANYGSPCDDRNVNTYNDQIDENCNCTGTPILCTGIDDEDGDGICANVDCDDSNPNITHQPGDSCDDRNPNTMGETIQDDCSCGGGTTTPTFSCSKVSRSSDDAEQWPSGQVDLNSSDLELATDFNHGNPNLH